VKSGAELDRNKVSEQTSEQLSGAKQAGARLTHIVNIITPGVVTARGEATITYNNRSRRNYTQTKLAIER